MKSTFPTDSLKINFDITSIYAQVLTGLFFQVFFLDRFFLHPINFIRYRDVTRPCWVWVAETSLDKLQAND